MELPHLLANSMLKLLDIWTFPVLRIGVKEGRPYAEFLPGETPPATIDARLAKIELAKANLQEALGAIEELQRAAQENKAELAAAIERLDRAQTERQAAERELEAVRSIAENDVAVFQRLAGVPSKLDIARERLVGFLLGVLASVAASGLWWGAAKLWPLLKT